MISANVMASTIACMRPWEAWGFIAWAASPISAAPSATQRDVRTLPVGMYAV